MRFESAKLITMTVYIEVVILDNFIITYLLIKLTKYLCNMRASKLFCLLGGLTGSGFSVFYPFISGTIFLWLYRIVDFLAITLLCFHGKRYFLQSGVFLLSTFMLGGCLFMINYFRYNDIALALSMPISSLGFSGVLLICYILIKFARCILGVSRRKCLPRQCVYPCKLTLLGQDIDLNVFIDTGNLLYDSVTNLPIVLVSAGSILSAYDDEFTYKFYLGKGEDLGGRYENIVSASGKSRVLVFNPQKFALYFNGKEHIYNVMIGVSITRFDGFDGVMGLIKEV